MQKTERTYYDSKITQGQNTPSKKLIFHHFFDILDKI